MEKDLENFIDTPEPCDVIKPDSDIEDINEIISEGGICETSKNSFTNDSNEFVHVFDDNKKKCSSTRYTKIFDTEFYWGVPYLMDVQKYKAVVGNACRMSDKHIKSVTFKSEVDMCKLTYYDRKKVGMFDGPRNGDTVLYEKTLYDCRLFVFATDDVEDNDWGYDCLMFGSTYIDNNYTINDFKELIKKITDCIIGIDKERVKEDIKEINKIIKQQEKEKGFLNNLI